MRFLADENFDFAVVRALRAAGHEVRFPGGARQALATSVVELVASRGGDLVGSFTVLSPGQARITPGPRRSSSG